MKYAGKGAISVQVVQQNSSPRQGLYLRVGIIHTALWNPVFWVYFRVCKRAPVTERAEVAINNGSKPMLS